MVLGQFEKEFNGGGNCVYSCGRRNKKPALLEA
jgi:hypothetical protein